MIWNKSFGGMASSCVIEFYSFYSLTQSPFDKVLQQVFFLNRSPVVIITLTDSISFSLKSLPQNRWYNSPYYLFHFEFLGKGKVIFDGTVPSKNCVKVMITTGLETESEIWNGIAWFNLGGGVDFRLCSEGDFLTGHPQSIFATLQQFITKLICNDFGSAINTLNSSDKGQP